MKRLASLLLIFLSTAIVHAQCTPGGGVTCTPNLNLWLLPPHYLNWNIPWNQNAAIIDSIPTLAVLLNPTASQTVTQPVATYTNFNTPLIFGTQPALLYGTAAGNPSAYLTLTGPGQFSLDTTTKGNSGSSLKLAQVNAVNGYKVNGSGGTAGQCLASDGTAFNTVVACITSISNFYQTVNLASVPQTQRLALNFSNRFTASDSSVPSQTTIDLALVGTAGTYTNPVSITFDAYGRETAVVASSAVSRVCSGAYPTFSCYKVEPDGTIFSWGSISVTFSSASVATGTITFPNTGPNAFADNPSLTISLATDPSSATPPNSVTDYFENLTTSGATAVIRCAVNIGGSGCPGSMSTSVPFHWQAIGHN